MKVPLVDLQAQYAAIRDELEPAVLRVLASGHYIMGADVAELEREVAGDHAVPHAIGVSSGSDALLAALWAIGVGPGDEVITTALSFFATAGSIARLGATPVFADIDRTFNIDPASALDRITPRTKAIVPVHLFGRPADLPSFAVSGLPVVEDAAQAYGFAPTAMPARSKIAGAIAAAGVVTGAVAAAAETGVAAAGVPAGAGELARGAAAGYGATGGIEGNAFRRIATLSFFPTKNLGAAGDAGMVLLDDSALADRIRLYRTHGARPKNVHRVIGANLRMDTLQAAILRVKRRHVAAWTAKRRTNATTYRTLLAGTPLVLPADSPEHVWHHFVVRVVPRASGGREELRAFLAARDIETEVYYPRPLHLQPCFSGRQGDCPEAERAANEVLALPIHADLVEDQLAHVAASIRAFYGG